MTTKVIFLTSGTSWTVPSDWNSSSNTIECIGGGGGSRKGRAGGGGAYSLKSNVALTPGNSVTYSVGIGGISDDTFDSKGTDGGPGGSTWFNGASLAASSVGANGGAGANLGSTGGQATTGIGDVKYSGGNGNSSYNYCGGGGGAAGPHGNGGNGYSPTDNTGGGGGGADGGSSATSGTGGANRLGSGGGTSGSGSNGGNGSSGGGGGGGATAYNGGNASAEAIWTQTSDSATAGPGSGAGGGGNTSGETAGIAAVSGAYGGGAGGAYQTTIAPNGAPGIIVITYAAAASSALSGTATEATDTLSSGTIASRLALSGTAAAIRKILTSGAATSPRTATASVSVTRAATSGLITQGATSSLSGSVSASRDLIPSAGMGTPCALSGTPATVRKPATASATSPRIATASVSLARPGASGSISRQAETLTGAASGKRDTASANISAPVQMSGSGLTAKTIASGSLHATQPAYLSGTASAIRTIASGSLYAAQADRYLTGGCVSTRKILLGHLQDPVQMSGSASIKALLFQGPMNLPRYLAGSVSEKRSSAPSRARLVNSSEAFLLSVI